MIYWTGLWPEIQSKLAPERHTLRTMSDIRRRALAVCSSPPSSNPAPAARGGAARAHRPRPGTSPPSSGFCDHPGHTSRNIQHYWEDCTLNKDSKNFLPGALEKFEKAKRYAREADAPGSPAPARAMSAMSVPPPDHGNFGQRMTLPADYQHVGTVLSDFGNRYHVLDAGTPGTMYLGREPPAHEEAGADCRD